MLHVLLLTNISIEALHRAAEGFYLFEEESIIFRLAPRPGKKDKIASPV
jgi:hypothetical protein